MALGEEDFFTVALSRANVPPKIDPSFIKVITDSFGKKKGGYEVATILRYRDAASAIFSLHDSFASLMAGTGDFIQDLRQLARGTEAKSIANKLLEQADRLFEEDQSNRGFLIGAMILIDEKSWPNILKRLDRIYLPNSSLKCTTCV